MRKRFDEFLGLSALLTGFDRVDLQSTGIASDFLTKLDEILPAGMTDQLLEVYAGLPKGSGREAALEAAILGDAKFGPVARSLILLWYCGSWTVLPDEWHSAYGESPHEQGGTVSAQAYLGGTAMAGCGGPRTRQRAAGLGGDRALAGY
ncbi:MAG TPA: hypothetical protein VMB03_11325 [Bryobacteraceae bacterium]|nr:hypothetical protein [Bryobacteraceae bacterium]